MGNPSLCFLLASGSNARGQLGNGTYDDSHVFQLCRFASGTSASAQLPARTRRILQLGSGANHTLALLQVDADVDVLSDSRRDGESALGAGEDTDTEFTPEAGASSDGNTRTQTELWGCGDGRKGQLGPTYKIQQDTDKSFNSAIFRRLTLPIGSLPGSAAGILTYSAYSCRNVAVAWDTTYLVLSADGQPDLLVSMGVPLQDRQRDDWRQYRRQHEDDVNVISFDHLLVDEGPIDTSSLRIVSIVAGPRHVIVQVDVRLLNGDLRTLLVGWGADRQGQLGGRPSYLKAAQSDSAQCPRVLLVDVAPDAICACALGSQHTVLLHASGRVSGLGSNKQGQLQDIVSLSNVRLVASTWNGSYFGLVDGSSAGEISVIATGNNSKGQLGRGGRTSSDQSQATSKLGPVQFPLRMRGKHLRKMTCGSEHVLTWTSSSADDDTSEEVWGWGWNEHGNLGLGTTQDVLSPIQIWPSGVVNINMSEATKIVDIWGGCGTSWIALAR